MNILCADSLVWLPDHPDQGAIVTSLPEVSELPHVPFEEYGSWLAQAARLCFGSLSEDCPIVFLQTDRKHDGRWLDKSFALSAVAEECGYWMLWHKIELRGKPGTMDWRRPGFRHVLAYGRGKTRPGDATPDIIPPSQPLYADGVGKLAAEEAVRLCLLTNNAPRILDPFCGQGTFLAAAQRLGAKDITGIDISVEQCRLARDASYKHGSLWDLGPQG